MNGYVKKTYEKSVYEIDFLIWIYVRTAHQNSLISPFIIRYIFVSIFCIHFFHFMQVRRLLTHLHNQHQ